MSWDKALERFRDVYADYPYGTVWPYVQPRELSGGAHLQRFGYWADAIAAKSSGKIGHVATAGEFDDGSRLLFYALYWPAIETAPSGKRTVRQDYGAWWRAFAPAARYAGTLMDGAALAETGIRLERQQPLQGAWLAYVWHRAGRPDCLRQVPRLSIDAVEAMAPKLPNGTSRIPLVGTISPGAGFPQSSPSKVKASLGQRHAARGVERGADMSEGFIPTAVQQRILDALEGAALTTDALANEARCDRGYMFKALKQLRALGLVDHRKRHGFYRPKGRPAQGSATIPPPMRD